MQLFMPNNSEQSELRRGYSRILLNMVLQNGNSSCVEIENIMAARYPAKNADPGYCTPEAVKSPVVLKEWIRSLMHISEDWAAADSHVEKSRLIIRNLGSAGFPAEKIEAAVGRYREIHYNLDTMQDSDGESGLIGQDPKWLQLLQSAGKIARTDAPVMIMGETGSGKDKVAEYIHTLSSRHDRPYIPVNCGALPQNLIASELFGYENGAFTGAQRGGRKGRVENAVGGTILLDDVDALPMTAQAALLRFIENGEIQKIGGVTLAGTDVRIICTSNRNLMQMAENKEFRTDLYYRLCIFKLRVPPLRERKSDLPLFTYHFLKNLNPDISPAGFAAITDRAVEKLLDHTWPGNLRELQSVLWRAAIECRDGLIDIQDVVFDSSPENDTPEELETKLYLIDSAMAEFLSGLPFGGTDLVRFLTDHLDKPIRNLDWVERFGVSSSTARNRLNELVKSGFLRQEGSKRGTKYYVEKEKFTSSKS